MKCVIRTLKEPVTDQTLPVFPKIVLKNYLTTTQNGQYIYLDDIYVKFNNTKVDVVYEREDGSLMKIIALASVAYLSNNSSYCVPFNQTRVDYFAVQNNTEIHAGFDTSNGTAYVDNNSGTAATPVSTSGFGYVMRVFAYNDTDGDSVAGKIKIKSIYIKTENGNGGYDEYTLVPALLGDKAVLYDATRSKVYGEANGGDLVCG